MEPPLSLILDEIANLCAVPSLPAAQTAAAPSPPASG
ncbi:MULTISPECIES: type IV secretory system conjugative DNA transfer family protein [Kribbella]|nr:MULTISPECIES: type IV secretory system conjugative DNA transfer family protein [Kribbella]